MSITKLDCMELQDTRYSVYPYDGYNLEEILGKFYEAIKECNDLSFSLQEFNNWIISEGLAEEVAKQLSKVDWDTIINSEIYQNVIDFLEETKGQINENVKEIEKTKDIINGIYEDNLRIFKPTFGFNALGSPCSDSKTFEQQKTLLDTMKDIGVTDIPYCVKIVENDDGVMSIGEDTVLIQKCVDYCKTNAINIPIIHVYVDQDHSTKSNFNSEYKRMINEIMTLFEGVNYRYFIIWNEATQRIKNDLVKNTILECMEIVKERGKKVGIALMGLSPIGYLDKQLFEKSNFISFNQYPSISYKYDKTTVEDSIKSWKDSGVKEGVDYIQTNYPNKEIIISESGICGSYECLINPAIPPKDWQTYDFNGHVCELYYTGLFESLKNVPISAVYGWFPHDFVKYPEPMKKLYSKYFKGGK